MEKYNKPPRDPNTVVPQLLLPLSLGVSSSTLLYMLDTELHRRLANAHTKKPYNLQVLVIEPSTILSSNAPYDKNYEALQAAFPMHTYTRVPFHSIFDYVPDMKEIMLEYAGPQFTDNTSLNSESRLAAFRTTITTPTSKSDLDQVLLTRLVVGFAKQTGCDTVLWGDSDSRLAAKTLAGAAKGRGASLTWQVSDGMSPWGVGFEFPSRDLSKIELEQFASCCPELADIIIPGQPVSDNILTKNLSIDELMMRYVLTQGEKYRGIMSNVSRTANKLQSTHDANSAKCSLCGALVDNVEGNDSAIAASIDDQGSQFCYGCLRSRPEVIN